MDKSWLVGRLATIFFVPTLVNTSIERNGRCNDL
nr:MAG TPA: hypothetical protein [Caudoviricetes sp.]DAX47099.1 MAG TPA: hypothetical protein [Caudoviricetes sp.]